MTRKPLDELGLLQEASARSLALALGRVQVAELRGDPAAQARAERTLTRRLANVMATADLLGRRRLLLEVEALTGAKFAVRDVPFLPAVPFDEAIQEILKRRPALVSGWEAARDAYQGGAFALARAATVQVAARVQKTLVRSLREGTPARQAVDEIAAAVGQAGDPAVSAYADTVFRTLTASAYAAGRHQQSQDPAVKAVAPALRYVATRDPDVRDNHLAAHNFVAHSDDEAWERISPPNGFQCRCSIELVPFAEARRAGVVSPLGTPIPQSVPAGAGADVGFRRAGRPDRQFYG